MWIPRLAAALLAAPIALLAAQAPPPPPPPMSAAGSPAAPLDPATAAAVSGVVVDAATGAPVAGAVVEVSLEGRTIRTDAARPRATDERGRFVFTDLTGGTLAIRASAMGYLSSGFSAEGWSAVDRFPVRPGEWVNDVRIALARPGTIAGAVLDELGEPVVGVVVGVVERIRVAGAGRYMSGRAAVTDDRGHFRIIDLTPGDYLVQVPGSAASTPVNPIPTPWPGQPPSPPPDEAGQQRTYATAFHPGVATASQAQVVSLRAGETREGVDIRLAPSRATRLEGTIEGPSDWVSGLAVRLVPESGTGIAAEAPETRTDSTGQFVFERVPEGAYTLVAGRRWSELTRGYRLGEPSLRSPGGAGMGGMTQQLESGPSGLQLQTSSINGLNSNALLASAPLAVSGPTMSGVVIRARALATLRGAVTRDIDRRHPVPQLQPAGGLHLDPANGSIEFGMPRSEARPDDATEEFSIDGITPGEFHLRSSFGWLIKSATWNGRDFARIPFDASDATSFDNVAVVVTNASASVRGTVRDADGPATVVLFPASSERWSGFGLMPVDVRRVATAGDGRFIITGLPAGEYYLAAVAGDRAIELYRDTFSQLQPTATTIAVDWGDSRSVELRLIGGQP